MNKHYKEEKFDSNIESKIIETCLPVGKLLLALFLLLPVKLYSQVPINGFCEYNSSLIDSGFNSVTTFANDNSRHSNLHLFAYSKNKRQIALYHYTKHKRFDLQNFLSLRGNPSSIIPLNKKMNSFVYSSRKSRKVGIFKLTDNKRIYFTSDISFNSYPQNLSVSDLNNDGNNEILVSGSAFNGLSVLFTGSNKIFEKKIAENSIYSKAIFADINNDSLSDIVGYNLLSDSLDLFYNQGDSTFYKARSINLGGKVECLLSMDLNKDSYPDIIYSMENTIHILFGDFRNSYTNEATLNTEFSPDKLAVGDFNDDGKTDIAYLDTAQGIISIFFAKSQSDQSWYKEYTLMGSKNLEDIEVSKVDKKAVLFGLTRGGEIFSITHLENYFKDIKLVFTPQPSDISFFKYSKNTNYCLIDNSSDELKIILTGSNSIPKTIYSLPLAEDKSDVVVSKISPNTFGFFCYNVGGKMIEFYVINFVTKNVSKRIVYALNTIDDLNVLTSKNKIESIIYSYILQNKFGVSELKNIDNKFQDEKVFEIDENVLASKIFLGKKKMVYYWVKYDKYIRLYKKQLYDPYMASELNVTPVNNLQKILTFWPNVVRDSVNNLVSLIITQKKLMSVEKSRNKFYTRNVFGQSNFLTNDDYSLAKSPKPREIFIYSKQKKSLFNLRFEKNYYRVSLRKIIGKLQLHKFFVNKINSGNEFLIFLQNSSIIRFMEI